jgi:hypothetical protein
MLRKNEFLSRVGRKPLGMVRRHLLTFERALDDTPSFHCHIVGFGLFIQKKFESVHRQSEGSAGLCQAVI